MSIFGSLAQSAATLGSAGLNYAAANQAADVSADAARSANRLRREIYNRSRQDMAPYRAAGYGALDQQAQLLGIGVDTQAGSSLEDAQSQIERLEQMRSEGQTTYNGAPIDQTISELERRVPIFQRRASRQIGEQVTNRLRQTPGYQFRMNEGIQARDRSAAARGMTLSGAQQKALTEYGQGLADQTYGQQLNRLASLAGTGQTATQNVASMGQNYAAGAGQNLMGAAQARGSSYLTGANQAGNALNSLAYIWS